MQPPAPSQPATNAILTLLRYTLTAQLLLGGQARLTSRLTPSLHRRAMAKAPGTRKYLPFIPIRDPVRHTHFIGAMMCLAGVMLCLDVEGLRLRLAGAVLAVSLTLAGVWTQVRMGIPWWLPGVNSVVAGVVIWGELAR